MPTSSSSLATTQLSLGKKKKQDAQKKNTHKRQLGPFATNTAIIALSVASNCQRSTAGAKQSRFGAGCSSLKNSKGNGWISLRLFITSQPCWGIQNFRYILFMNLAKTKKWFSIYSSKYDLAIFCIISELIQGLVLLQVNSLQVCDKASFYYLFVYVWL